MAVVGVQTRPATLGLEAAVETVRAGVQAMSALVRRADGEALGEALIQIREAGIDPLEAPFKRANHSIRATTRPSRWLKRMRHRIMKCWRNYSAAIG